MNLTISILDFGVPLYGGSELSKHLSKCLLRMRKTQDIETNPNFIYDGRNFRRHSVNVIDKNVRSYLFFSVQTFRTKISDSVCNDLKNFIS